MKTVEEILIKYLRKIDLINKGEIKHLVYPSDSILAMQEYAKQEAIEFEKWKVRNYVTINIYGKYFSAIQTIGYAGQSFDAAELYEEYLKSKQH